VEPQDLLPIEPQLLNAGHPTVIVAAKDKAAVDRAWLDLVGLKALKGGETEPFCVFLFTPTPEGAYSRMFAPENGVVEDPATGSSSASLWIGCIPAYGNVHSTHAKGAEADEHTMGKRGSAI